MAFTNKLELKQFDSVNDKIWYNLHLQETDKLNLLDPNSFSMEYIINEINTGCSPCPDILSKDFGVNSSVMFVSTVYGLINKYIHMEYKRTEQHWSQFSKDFYSRIIQSGTGIYRRLDKIYKLLVEVGGKELDFCFTELVKTVLIDHKNKVSGLGNRGSFINYFEKAEFYLLEERISQIENECFIFSFSEEVTYFLIKILSNSPKLVDYFDIIHTENKCITVNKRRKRTGDFEFNISADGTYSNTIAFKTILKVKNKSIYIIPLPHPSTSNNRYWPEDRCWGDLKALLSLTK